MSPWPCWPSIIMKTRRDSRLRTELRQNSSKAHPMADHQLCMAGWIKYHLTHFSFANRRSRVNIFRTSCNRQSGLFAEPKGRGYLARIRVRNLWQGELLAFDLCQGGKLIDYRLQCTLGVRAKLYELRVRGGTAIRAPFRFSFRGLVWEF